MSVDKLYGGFWSPHHLLSYGRTMMISVGSRSIGKSTGIEIYFIKDYLDNGHEFVYTRRTKDELMETCKTFGEGGVEILRDNGYTITEYKYEKGCYWIKRGEEEEFECCGYAIPLSQQYKFKSGHYYNVYNLLYDEFIAPLNKMYLGTKQNILVEYDFLINLCKTIDRQKGKAFANRLRIFMCANADPGKQTLYTPVFVALHADKYIYPDTKVCAPKGKQWVIEFTSQVEATKDFEESNLYQLSTDADKASTFANQIINTDEAFVEKINAPMQAIINLQYNNDVMGVYQVPSRGVVYVGGKSNCLSTIALTTEDHDQINFMLAFKYSDSPYMQMLKDAIYSGYIVYENNKIKNYLSRYFMLTP